MSHAAKKFHFKLFTNHLTPNGLKVSIYLEELKASKDPSLDYEVVRVDLSKGVHREDWFTEMNPNGRIPVLFDDIRNFPIFESAAILMYLEQNVDIQKQFSVDMTKFPREYSLMYQWVFFGHGGVSPIQSQAHYFLHYSPEDDPVGKARFCDETRRLYGVLNTGLAGRDWFVTGAGGKSRYTIADMSIFPWVRLHPRAGIPTLDEWPSLKAWLARMSDRPGVKSACRSVAL